MCRGLWRAGARAAADAGHRHRAAATGGERSFRAPAPFRSRGIVCHLRRLQHPCRAAADHACPTQRLDAKADRSAGRGAPPSCARVARRLRAVAFGHRGADRRGRPYRGARRPATLRRRPGHLAPAPRLDEECRGIRGTTAYMMAAVRGAPVRLRAPYIEELGLTISRESVVASWNDFEKGRTRFEIAVIRSADDLPPGVSASL